MVFLGMPPGPPTLGRSHGPLRPGLLLCALLCSCIALLLQRGTRSLVLPSQEVLQVPRARTMPLIEMPAPLHPRVARQPRHHPLPAPAPPAVPGPPLPHATAFPPTLPAPLVALAGLCGAAAAALLRRRPGHGGGPGASAMLAAAAKPKYRPKMPNPLKDTKTMWNLSGTNLGKVAGTGFAKLCRAIKRNLVEGSTLSVMYLPEDAGRPLLEAFKENETIQKFDASGNPLGMGDREVSLWWECLTVNKSLRILIFINNNIEDRGAEFLAEGMKFNS
eukprot:EG_transcript_23607